MSRWDIFRWRTLAGGRWCPVGTVQRRPRRQPRPLMASSMPRRFSPSFPVTPPKACAALWYKRRRGDTELCGALAGCPLSRLAATASRLLALSVTATPCQLPQRGSQVGSSPEACRKPSLASPFGGGALQRRAERATALPSGKGAGNQRLPGCFPRFLSCAARL